MTTIRQQIDALIDKTIPNYTIRDDYYDWFSEDHDSAEKALRLYNYLIQIVGTKKFSLDRTHVVFHSHFGHWNTNRTTPHDVMSIRDENDNVIYNIIPDSGHARVEGNGEIWCKGKVILEGTWSEIKEFFCPDIDGN